MKNLTLICLNLLFSDYPYVDYNQQTLTLSPLIPAEHETYQIHCIFISMHMPAVWGTQALYLMANPIRCSRLSLKRLDIPLYLFSWELFVFYRSLLHKVLMATSLLPGKFGHQLCRYALYCANLMAWLT